MIIYPQVWSRLLPEHWEGWAQHGRVCGDRGCGRGSGFPEGNDNEVGYPNFPRVKLMLSWCLSLLRCGLILPNIGKIIISYFHRLIKSIVPNASIHTQNEFEISYLLPWDAFKQVWHVPLAAFQSSGSRDKLRITRQPAGLVYASCHVICSLSRDPLDYLRLTINITLDYGIRARGEIGTLCPTPWMDPLKSLDCPIYFLR